MPPLCHRGPGNGSVSQGVCPRKAAHCPHGAHAVGSAAARWVGQSRSSSRAPPCPSVWIQRRPGRGNAQASEILFFLPCPVLNPWLMVSLVYVQGSREEVGTGFKLRAGTCRYIPAMGPLVIYSLQLEADLSFRLLSPWTLQAANIFPS